MPPKAVVDGPDNTTLTALSRAQSDLFNLEKCAALVLPRSSLSNRALHIDAAAHFPYLVCPGTLVNKPYLFLAWIR